VKVAPRVRGVKEARLFAGFRFLKGASRVAA
jgi:hypothetical protein